MQFKSFVLAAFAASATSVVASDKDSCAAGAIIGIYALCGSHPVDCGSSKCCLEGQKCVKSDGDFKCADSALVPSSTVTVNAACYGTATASASASASATGSKTSSKPASQSASETASASASGQGAGGSYGSHGSKTSSSSAPYNTGGSSSSSPSSGGDYSGSNSGSPYTYTNGTSGYGGASPSGTVSSGPVLATANAASLSSPNNVAALLSAMGFLAYLL